MHKWLKPNIAVFGFAFFLAIHATSVWGGAFPLLPLEMQTFDVMMMFCAVESVVFTVSLIAGMLLSYFAPTLLRHKTSVLSGPIMCLGSICLIAPLYIPAWLTGLIIIGAVSLGVGSAAFFLSWQRLFASQEADRGTLDLILGMGWSAPIYFLLHIIPNAVAAYTIPFIFIPLAEACLIEASRTIDFSEPMFADIPRDHPRVYTHAASATWRSALCVGCLGFASGIARAIALEDPSMGALVNYASMVGALISAIALVWLWRHYTFKFDTVFAFRTVFPAIITAFLVLPYFGSDYLRIFAGVMYAFFSFGTMIMMIQCAQISRYSGISPTFIYGFFAGIVYFLQSLGFFIGYGSSALFASSELQIATMSLNSVWVLALALYVVRGKFGSGEEPASAVEFIVLDKDREQRNQEITPVAKASSDNSPSYNNPTERETIYKDKLSKQCALVAQQYFLTAREAEVMELLARGNSVPRIAETLIISENTVKTYCKRLYVKVDVHKREELLDRIEEIAEASYK